MLDPNRFRPYLGDWKIQTINRTNMWLTSCEIELLGVSGWYTKHNHTMRHWTNGITNLFWHIFVGTIISLSLVATQFNSLAFSLVRLFDLDLSNFHAIHYSQMPSRQPTTGRPTDRNERTRKQVKMNGKKRLGMSMFGSPCLSFLAFTDSIPFTQHFATVYTYI